MTASRPPHGAIAHLAINSDDLARSQTFYERLFGWRFRPWGPPGFFQIETPGAPIIAAMQQRRELLDGQKTVGFECTVAVDDVAAAIVIALECGGCVLMPPVTIPTVCEIAFLEDPGGNVVGVARYDAAAS
jgi:predicted enzyme related to lactoylglutathione lyase